MGLVVLIVLGVVLVAIVTAVVTLVVCHILLRKYVARIDPRDLERGRVNRPQREIWIPEENVREIKSE